MKKVLIIEDDPNLVNLLNIHLTDLECQVTKTYDGKIGLDTALTQPFDLIILDLMLPEMDGFQVCQNIRNAQNTTPILMLTARSEEMDKVLGLETGADDYLTKPFGIKEFIARVKAIFRRMDMFVHNKTLKKQGKISCGGLQVDIDNRKVSIAKKRVELTPKEFDLLVLLAANPGKSYSRNRILRLVWGYEFDGYEHTVNSHINRLRAKIEPNLSKPTYILTTWGVGYRFTEDC